MLRCFNNLLVIHLLRPYMTDYQIHIKYWLTIVIRIYNVTRCIISVCISRYIDIIQDIYPTFERNGVH